MIFLRHLSCVSALLLSSFSFSQDTLFVRSLPAIGRVSNISTDNNSLYARINDSIYRWDNGFIPYALGKFTYSWVKRDRNELIINHSKQISILDRTKPELVSKLIPGIELQNITSATIGRRFYLCYNGNILEYHINPFVKLLYRQKSVRHIFSEPNLRVVSTYDGIYVDTLFDSFSQIPVDYSTASYSNGEFTRIDSNYFLCQDNLLLFNKHARKWEIYINTEGKPRFIKIFKFKGKVYGLFDKAFGEVDIEKRTVTRLLKYALFTDYEILDGKLFLSTLDKGLFIYLPKTEAFEEKELELAINDLTVKDDQLYLSTENGVFKLKIDNETLETIFEGRNVVQTVFYDDNLIFTTSGGLLAYKNGEFTRIIENVELNRMALLLDQHYLYAGSVFGLYVIETTVLMNIIGSKTVGKVETNNQNVIYYYVISMIIILIIALFIFYYSRRRLKNNLILKEKTLINSATIAELIKIDESILSVSDIASYYNTSVTQLNRKLKKENTKALALLKEIKSDVAKEMLKKGKSLDDIAKRTGYTKRYVREKLL